MYDRRCNITSVLMLLCMSFCVAVAVDVDVGVILNLDTTVGKMSQTCMSMALEDFYASHNYTTKIVPHIRDSKTDIVEAASAAIDLLKNVQVQAILGPERSTQADFVIDIGNKAKVPIISTATSPSLTPKENPFFVRSGQCSSYHTKAIAGIVDAFSWRQVVIIYEDSNYGSGVVPYLTDALLKVSTNVPYRSVIPPSAADDQILQELYKLMTMQSRVFVVHMLPSLASRLFLKAKEAGMMSKGYAWIITDALTSLVNSMNSTVLDSMQGVLGVKAHVPKSDELDNFATRWKMRFRQENSDMDRVELNVFSLWAYDSVFALAMALERADVAPQQFKEPANRENLTDLAAIGTSIMGSKLLKAIQGVRFKGLSGDFQIVDGQLPLSAFEIVNVIGKGERVIGFWTEKYGISSIVKPQNKDSYTTYKDDLGAIIWPGESSVVPKGWEIPTGEKKLRVGVPVKNGFEEFIKVEKDPKGNTILATGFCVDVFKAVMESLPYAVPYEFIPFETPDGQSAGNYNDLVYQIFLQKFDAVVGDVTIVANRSSFVDFTLPFTESGVRMIVPIKDDQRKNAWIFMKPLTMDLWLTTGAFFIVTGIVVWVLEHRVNKEFRGPRDTQFGIVFWFAFSTLVFAHKEKLVSNLSRFVVIVWVFVVLVLTSSYTASLTSMLTVQQLQPAFTDITELMKNGEYVGYQKGSFIAGLLEGMKFDGSKFKTYSTFEEYHEALSNGSRNGGVAAIVDELPYIRLFLAKYCTKYTIVGPTYKTAGFGFAFPKGSPLVPDVSRAVLDMTEGEKMRKISRQWLGDDVSCPEQNGAMVTSDSLTPDSFRGLFLIAGISLGSALILFLLRFLYKIREILASEDSVWEKLVKIAKKFDELEEESPSASKNASTAKVAAETAVAPLVSQAMVPDCSRSPTAGEAIISQDEGFPITELGSPYHDAVTIQETTEPKVDCFEIEPSHSTSSM